MKFAGMRKSAAILVSASVAGVCACRADTVEVEPGNCVIVAKGGTNGAVAVRNAAAELARHLKLITGVEPAIIAGADKISGRYPFYVGIAPEGSTAPLQPEEARRLAGARASYFYGEGDNGPLFAVYGFLEDSLGVRWLEPGNQGIVCRRQSPLRFGAGASTWAPELLIRSIRVGYKHDDQSTADALEWQARMRMGNRSDFNYGHAFTDWWHKYGEDYPAPFGQVPRQAHPEYFAMLSDGKRAPFKNNYAGIMLCPSCPGLADQIIEDWLATKPGRTRGINVCENDGGKFCACENCRALDVPAEGGKRPFPHLTDRYIFLCNAVARKAREHDPEAFVTTYAYNQTELPPSREKLDPNIVIGIVPTTIDRRQLEKLFSGWRAAGATKMFLRPNFHHVYFKLAVPAGFERHFFDLFQVAYKSGMLVGCDYDSMMKSWPVTGLADYIQARAFSDPSKPFEYWEDHYCAAYGPAAEDVKQYFRHWRSEVWEKRVEPDLGSLKIGGRNDLFRTLMGAAGKYYQQDDFDRTDALLREAARKQLSDSARFQLDQLILANKYGRLVFNAAASKGAAKAPHARALVEFQNSRAKWTLPWMVMFWRVKGLGDISGLAAASGPEAKGASAPPAPSLLDNAGDELELGN